MKNDDNDGGSGFQVWKKQKTRIKQEQETRSG
jgi:hypothetical protein